MKTSASHQAAVGAFFGHPAPSPCLPPSHQLAHRWGLPLLKQVPGANPALEHFPAKNTAASGCSSAPHLAIRCYRSLDIKLAGQVRVAGPCWAWWVEELRVTLQDGMGGVSGVSGSSHPPPPFGCTTAAHTLTGRGRLVGSLGRRQLPARQQPRAVASKATSETLTCLHPHWREDGNKVSGSSSLALHGLQAVGKRWYFPATARTSAHCFLSGFLASF